MDLGIGSISFLKLRINYLIKENEVCKKMPGLETAIQKWVSL